MDDEARKQWLAERQKGIGGSDIPAIAGLNPYKSAFQVWQSKTGTIKETDSPPAKTGRILEPYIAEWFAEESELTVSIPKKEIYRDSLVPYFLASIDRFEGEEESTKDGIIEIKTCMFFDDSKFAMWYSQVQWYLGVMNKNKALIVWVKLPFGFNYDRFNSLEINREMFDALKCSLSMNLEIVHRDESYIKKIRNEAKRFWEAYVIPQVAPAELSAFDLLELYPKAERGKKAEATEEEYRTYESLRLVKEKISQLKKEEDSLKLNLINAIKDAEVLNYSGQTLATYKESQRATVDSKRLQQEKPEIYNEYLKNSISRSLLLK